MSELENVVDSMINAIKNTKEYQNYLREKEKISRFPDVAQQINEYRIKNYELQSMTSKEELFNKIDDFDREYEKFKEDPLVSDFQEAELDFCRMMQNITMTVTAALDFD